MSNKEAGFVLARRDYAGPGKEPQKDEVNGDAARRRPCLRATRRRPGAGNASESRKKGSRP
jgi:hypothetical protein